MDNSNDFEKNHSFKSRIKTLEELSNLQEEKINDLKKYIEMLENKTV